MIKIEDVLNEIEYKLDSARENPNGTVYWGHKGRKELYLSYDSMRDDYYVNLEFQKSGLYFEIKQSKVKSEELLDLLKKMIKKAKTI